jgi:hypothetical protein
MYMSVFDLNPNCSKYIRIRVQIGVQIEIQIVYILDPNSQLGQPSMPSVGPRLGQARPGSLIVESNTSRRRSLDALRT